MDVCRGKEELAEEKESDWCHYIVTVGMIIWIKSVRGKCLARGEVLLVTGGRETAYTKVSFD